MSNKKEPTITIGELKERLEIFPNDYRISFGGLEFDRLKQRGPNLVNMEFNEIVYIDNGKVVIDNLGKE